MRIIPLLVDGARMPAAEELPEPLQSFAFRNATAIRPDPDFHRDMHRVIQAIGEAVLLDVGDRPVQHKQPLSPLKYYLYVSRTKVEMLFAQISPEQRHQREGGGDIYNMLDSVIHRLDEERLIGACDQPLTYFRGVLDMHFADISFYRGGGRKLGRAR
jgi:hypothetical protein